MYEARLYLNGEQRTGSGAPFTVVNPATEEVLGTVSTAASDEVQEALAFAETGFATWAGTAPWSRSECLRRIGALMRERVEDLAVSLTLEIGKPLAEGRAEVLVSAEHFEWCADEARRLYDTSLAGRTPQSRLDIRNEPIGVVLALTAWNFPINLAARKLAMALAAGCSVILRPAEEAPMSIAALVRCCHDAGLPPGVVNLLYGSPETVVEPLMAAPSVRKVSFTGSTRVGQILIRQSADTVKRLTLELGGHAPFIVLDDADVEAAAAAAAAGRFRNAGQVCTSPSRFFVDRRVCDHFTEAFVAAACALRVGDGLDPATQMGPVATPRQRERAERLIDDARRKGATVAAGGGRVSDMNRGYFVQPTVLADVPEDAAIMTEEPFVPVACVVGVADAGEAVRRANGLEAALASYVFTRSLERAEQVSAALQAGLVGVNTIAVAIPEGPFGGVKASGYGREGGAEGVREYLVTKFTHRVRP